MSDEQIPGQMGVDECIAEAAASSDPKMKALRERLDDPHNPANVIDVSARLEAGGRATRISRTDMGNAERLVEDHAGDLLHVAGRWYVWDGRRFRPDDTGEIMRRAKQTVRIMAHEAVEIGGDLGSKLTGWGLKSRSRARLEAMVVVAASEPGVAHRADELDANPMLLNVLNGTVDLCTCRLRAHDPADLITKLAPVTYDPNATCPLWERCVEQWWVDQDTIGYVQRAVGYTLTGETSEQCMFVPDGRGGNGKTTFAETIRDLLGDYGTSIEAVTLTSVGSNRGIRSDLARLAGRRFVVASETEKETKFATALVKQITGNRFVVARFLYANEFEFTPSFKVWLDVNHLPKVDDNSHAFWRRMRVIPFPNTFPVNKPLPAKLLAESSGIFNWALAGCAAWQEHGLGDPTRSVARATDEYRAREDPLEPWIRGRIEVKAAAFTTNADLLADWIAWAENHGIDSDDCDVSVTEIGRRLTGHGSVDHDRTKQGRGLRGVKLVEG